MKTLFTILALSLCLGAMGQNIDTVIRIDTTGWTIRLAPLPPPDTTRIDGRTIVTYPDGYTEVDTFKVWFLVSNPDKHYPSIRVDSNATGMALVVIAGFKLVEREVYRREWEAGREYPLTMYYSNHFTINRYLYENKQEIWKLIIWDTKSR